MVYIYGEVSQELFCGAIMWGPSASSTSEGILFEVTIFGEMLWEKGFCSDLMELY